MLHILYHNLNLLSILGAKSNRLVDIGAEAAMLYACLIVEKFVVLHLTCHGKWR